jgi:glutaredoxin
MNSSSRSLRLAPLVPATALAAALLLAAPSIRAQFKVIGADGKVTYSDREPSASEGRVSALGARGAASQAAEADLPFEVRQAAAKYPITLYTTNGVCEPCNQARQFLKQRGVPFSERQAVSEEDIEALEKISGGREAPTMMLGTQVLRGFAADSWTQYLDAAGYPRESRLPPNYAYAPATPLVARAAPPAARAAETPAERPAAAPAPAANTGIKF